MKTQGKSPKSVETAEVQGELPLRQRNAWVLNASSDRLNQLISGDDFGRQAISMLDIKSAFSNKWVQGNRT